MDRVVVLALAAIAAWILIRPKQAGPSQPPASWAATLSAPEFMVRINTTTSLEALEALRWGPGGFETLLTGGRMSRAHYLMVFNLYNTRIAQLEALRLQPPADAEVLGVEFDWGPGGGSHQFSSDTPGRIGPVTVHFSYQGPATAVALEVTPPASVGVTNTNLVVIGPAAAPTPFTVTHRGFEWASNGLAAGVHRFDARFMEVDPGVLPEIQGRIDIRRVLASDSHDVTITIRSIFSAISFAFQ